MNVTLHGRDLAALHTQDCDTLVVLGTLPDFQQTATWGRLAQAVSQGLLAKAGDWLELAAPEGWACLRLIVAVAAPNQPKEVQRAVTAALARVEAHPGEQGVIAFLAKPSSAALQAAVLAAGAGMYRYSATRTERPSPRFARLLFAAPQIDGLTAVFSRALSIAAGVELAREWGNRPANHATPTHLAGVAQALARFPKVKCEVMDAAELTRLGMGALLAVARGSSEPPVFITLRYNGGGRGQAPVVLVGKGITFDSGGISIKPAAEMDEMKFDMCGAASVLGTFRALAELRPPINVVGLIPSCENLPSAHALKPGDVITSLSGTTIEVLNTDAEGRLILCDALTYAQRFKPRAVIDIATLTGACVIALGGVRSGLFATDDALTQALVQAGERAQDLCWPMPLDDDYAEGLKSSFADVANVGARPAGAVTAAKFLQRFAPCPAWAHLDVAGTAWKSGASKGATGRPVALLCEYLLGPADAAEVDVV